MSSHTPRVYVCAPFEDAGHVREHVHERLRTFGLEPSSRWAETARGAEDFAAFTPYALRAIAEANDLDLGNSQAALVLAREGTGGEMFAEARLALVMGIPVVWVGRRTLSAWRDGVVLVDDLDEAITVLRMLLGVAS